MKITEAEFESIVEESKQNILKSLPAEVPFLIKIKELSKSNWCALYRGGTFVRSGKAIIWINSSFPNMILEVEGGFVSEKADFLYSIRRNLIDTIAHELVHAIQEAVYFAENRKISAVAFDEDEAESLGLMLSRGESIENTPLIQKYINHYCD